MIFGFPKKRSHQSTPPLSDSAKEHLTKMFELSDQANAATLLCQVTGFDSKHLTSTECDRCRFAALKLSNGDIEKLRRAVDLFNKDARDLLMQAGFGEDLQAHENWQPEGFTDKWMSPISLALYSIMFVKGPVPDDHVRFAAQSLGDSNHDIARLLRHIEKELLNPSQNLGDIIKLQCSEDQARAYLQDLAGYLKSDDTDGN